MTGNRPRSLYHVGIVVPDVEAAQTALTEQLGVTWGPVLHLDEVEYRNGAGEDVMLPTTMCYSVDGPHLELIKEVPGSVWVRNEHSNLHHIGFWSDDLAAEGSDLTRAGCPLQMCGRSDDAAPVSFAYHRNDLGVRIELVDATLRETMGFLFEPDQR
jgi:Glyoxalase/Bleomycin resistance protein/Dioxygenase superfamily